MRRGGDRRQVLGREEVHTGFKCGGVRGREDLGDLGIDGQLNNEMYIQEVVW